MVQVAVLGEWRCFMASNGELSVMTAGIYLMLKLYAGSWAAGRLYLLLPQLTLGEGLTPFGLMTWPAKEPKLPSPNAVQNLGEAITVCTEKMLVLCAQVNPTLHDTGGFCGVWRDAGGAVGGPVPFGAMLSPTSKRTVRLKVIHTVKP